MGRAPEWAVFATIRQDGEIKVVQQTVEMPRAEAVAERERLQRLYTEPSKEVYESAAQFYAVNTVSGKILI